MAQVYNLEPQPTAKVLLNTTSGDLELELFAKQTPLASRNFLQLCLDGYYDGTIFHRLVPGFIIQGGDPTGSGHGGEASYDDGVFADEFHTRLRFNRRGLLGMANTGKKDDNGSQFFLTLAATPELDNRNTMFGRIVGDTIYNLMKMGDADLTDDGSERPLYPTKVTGTEILVNPFEDMVKREVKRRDVEVAKPAEKKKAKKKGKTLLSFAGDEDVDMEDAPVVKKPKFNTKLVSGGAEVSGPAPEKANGHAKKAIERPAPARSPSPAPVPAAKKVESAPVKAKSRSASSSPEPEQDTAQSLLERTNAQIAELKATMRRSVGHTQDIKPKKKSALEELIPASSIRGRKRKQGESDERAALQLLNQWKSKLETPSTTADNASTKAKGTTNGKGTIDNDEEARLCDLHFVANCMSCQAWDDEAEAKDDDNDKDWMDHSLSFAKDRLGKDLEWKKRNEEELVVIDPRQKERTILGEKKARTKEARSGGTREWDR